jgi:hypothetical protein
VKGIPAPSKLLDLRVKDLIVPSKPPLDKGVKRITWGRAASGS